ncbi:MAG: replication protein [Clostridiales bacterium]|nr:replication protein [Clostridiales bacterium]
MATRNTYYATLTYPESAPENWIELLEEEHIQALISPLHDKDIDSEGKTKKPHYHVILMFESLKSNNQVQAIVEKFGGVGVIPIQSLGAYSRYLCHLDNSEKAQYKCEDVKEISGANYKECCRQNSDKEKEEEKNLIELTRLILDKKIIYFHEIVELVLKEHNDLFRVLEQNAYYIRSVVMSLATQRERERNF